MIEVLDFVVTIFGLLLLATGMAKLDGWRRWKRIAWSLFDSRRLGTIVTIGVPSAEVAAGALVLLSPGAGLAVATVILALFAVGAMRLLRTHAGEDCGCFGALAPSRISIGLIIRNVVLAALTLILATTSWQREAGTAELKTVWLSAFALVLALAAAEFLRMRRALIHV